MTSQELPTKEQALPGRDSRISVPEKHFVNGNALQPPFCDHLQKIIFGMGCFWGAERKFWQLDGVYTTAVGYAAGSTPNPTYQEVCSGQTGHNEVVLVVYDPEKISTEQLLKTFWESHDPEKISTEQLLKTFWESHDPTQGMRQGNDRGTQYRSGIYVSDEEQRKVAEISLGVYQQELAKNGYGQITTEIIDAPEFYYAEDYHQQYLAKNPAGYCGLGGTGVCLK